MPKNYFLVFVLLIYVALTLGYSLIIPLGEAPDEVSHFAYVQTLTLQQQFPNKEGAASGQSHQAPLYYVLSALLSAWIPQQGFVYIANPDWELNNLLTPNLLLHTRAEGFPYQQTGQQTGQQAGQQDSLAWHVIRALSVCMGAMTLILTWKLAHTLFPNQQMVARLAIALIAFLPSFNFLTSTVNNDNLVVLLSVGTLLFFLRTWVVQPVSYPAHEQGLFEQPVLKRRAGGWTKHLILGLLLGLSLLAKFSAWVLWLTVALAILLDIRSTPHEPSNHFLSRLKNLCVIYGVALLVYSPWLLYNTIVYQDPFGWARLMDSTPRLEATTWQDWKIYAEHMFESLWGKLGGAGHIEIPRLFYLFFSLLVVVALLGWVRNIRIYRTSTPATNVLPIRQAALWVTLIFAILLFASHLRLYTVLLGADQARQIFSTLPIFAALIAAGLANWLKKPGSDWLFAIVMALLSATVLFFATTLYQPNITMAEIAPSSTPPVGDFGQQIRIMAYDVTPIQPISGETIAVTIRWQALTDIDKNYWFLLKLDGNGTTVASRESVPSAGLRTTDWWRKGETLTSTHKLQVPADLAPGMYELLLGMHPMGNWEWLKVNQQDVLKLSNFELQ